MRGLLVDLRSNPGGLLTEAVSTVNEFIGPQRRVVFSRGRIREANRDYVTRFNRIRENYPVVVLVNEASASASEIFAGSMQDWDRGIVVGRPTFGKGTVQQVRPLQGGHGMRITIARYYLNSGRCIHRQENDRLFRGDILTEEEREEIHQLNLQNIYHTISGREVFGGGGIFPDIEIDQTRMTRFEVEMRRLNLFFDFSMDYFMENRYNIPIDFQITPSIFYDFITFAEYRELEFEPEDIEESREFIEITLRREIIHRAHGETAGYIAGIPLDTQLQEAIRLFDRFSTVDEMFVYAASRRYQ
jgi:carboxyl-terminal processing protease